ncbi:adenosine deaminase [Pseudonocardia spinosispora]|uniref:adenosine deaminase n=1 Tax=Pseudonocardia spinosispora TaxID=103441 RepID=UPI0004075E76|nr:adenosine deaminase [Pseudonocardia spinosispora]
MPTPDIATFVAALPKVELHLHLVGSASVETVLALSRGHPDSTVPTDPDALGRFYEFTDFEHFLNVYRQVNLLVRTGADIVTLLDGLASDLAGNAVRYAEVQVTAVRNRMSGIEFDDLAQALADGRALAAEKYGVEFGWIFDADSRLGTAGAEETLDFALRYRPEGTVGLGLAGMERGVSRADYAPVFRRARDAGLHCLPHAGETVGPAEVWAAVTELGAERIGHGIGSVTDPRLLEQLAARDIALEVCPTSNVCTAAVPDLAAHPLPRLLAAGVPVTLATDDPGMFHTDLNTEYLVCHEQFGLGVAELADIARTGARAAFCSAELRARVLDEIDDLVEAVGQASR